MEPGELVCQKYRLTELIGRGGMAEVWAARNELTQRDFAIKLILPGLSRSSEALERFLQEAKATARLDHPSFVDVFDVGWTDDGRPFLVMELLRGESLEAAVARGGRMPALWTARTLAPIARALEIAHRAGIVHRDLSSANVFLTSTPKILDFGVSKIVEHEGRERGARVRTGNGAVLGSPGYMSPEQARGAENVDARSDVWALGVLAYECLTGELPFQARNYNALMLAIMGRAHLPVYERVPRLDPELAELVESCLIKDREARVQSAHEVAERLEEIARRLSRQPQRRAGDRTSLPPEPPKKAGWRGRAIAVCGAVGGTALGLAIGVALTRAPAPAENGTAAAPAKPDAHEPIVTPVATAANRPATQGEPRERDLVRAVARGLGVSKAPRTRRPKTAKPKPTPSELALAPRKNPY